MFISWVFYALGIFWYKCPSSGTTVQCIWTHEVYIAQCYGSLCEIIWKMHTFNFSGTVKSSPHYLTYAVLKNCNASVTYQPSMKLSKNKIL